MTEAANKALDAAASESGATAIKLIATGVTSAGSGGLAWLERGQSSVLFFAPLIISVIGFVALAGMLRYSRKRSGGAQDDPAEWARRRAEDLRAAWMNERQQRANVEQQLADNRAAMHEMRRLAQGVQREMIGVKQELHGVDRQRERLTAYGRATQEILGLAVEEIGGAADRSNPPETVLERMLHIAQTALCQYRTADTSLAVVADLQSDRKIVHESGLRRSHRSLRTADRPLADVAAALAPASHIIRLPEPLSSLSLVVLADGSLADPDKQLCGVVASAYGLARLAVANRQRHEV
jgi:hypothetical protein